MKTDLIELTHRDTNELLLVSAGSIASVTRVKSHTVIESKNNYYYLVTQTPQEIKTLIDAVED